MEYQFRPMGEPSLVERKRKYANFTVTEIGGPEEIKKWREEQDMKLAAYGMTLKDREERISHFASTYGGRVASPTTTGGKDRAWLDKLAEAKQMRADYMKPDILTQPEPWNWAPTHEPKLSFIKKLSKMVKSIWASANF